MIRNTGNNLAYYLNSFLHSICIPVVVAFLLSLYRFFHCIKQLEVISSSQMKTELPEKVYSLVLKGIPVIKHWLTNYI